MELADRFVEIVKVLIVVADRRQERRTQKARAEELRPELGADADVLVVVRALQALHLHVIGITRLIMSASMKLPLMPGIASGLMMRRWSKAVVRKLDERCEASSYCVPVVKFAFAKVVIAVAYVPPQREVVVARAFEARAQIEIGFSHGARAVHVVIVGSAGIEVPAARRRAVHAERAAADLGPNER